MDHGEGQEQQEGQPDPLLLDGHLAGGGRTRNVHLGSCARMDADAALQKAKAMKAEAHAQPLRAFWHVRCKAGVSRAGSFCGIGRSPHHGPGLAENPKELLAWLPVTGSIPQ